MRVDWQAAIVACGQSLAAANVLPQRAQPTTSATQQIAPAPVQGSDSDSLNSPPPGQASQLQTPANASETDSSAGSFEISASASAQVFAGVASKGDIETMQLLFARFDAMSLNTVFERVIPSMKKADEQAQYMAMCVNIQLAALAVKYIQSVRNFCLIFLFFSTLTLI